VWRQSSTRPRVVRQKQIASFFGLHDTPNQSIEFVDQRFIAEIHQH
jgi:hypothetical protein